MEQRNDLLLTIITSKSTQSPKLVAQHIKLDSNIRAVFPREKGSKLGIYFGLLVQKSSNRGFQVGIGGMTGAVAMTEAKIVKTG